MGERFVCSDASEQRQEGVVATASQVRGWLLIEVAGAWGVDAVTESALGPHVPDGWKAGLQRRGVRPICIRPAARVSAGDGIRLFHVVAGRPGARPGQTWTRTVVGLDEVADAVADLRLGHPPAGWAIHEHRIVLVCTNGKHDQCCANRGRPIVRHLRETRWADQVWECSHIGGDRFAANLVVLPDSLYFGRMDPLEAEALLDAHAEGDLALEWFRGRSTLRYVEQAAEHAVREHLGARGADDVVITCDPDTGAISAAVRGVGRLDITMRRDSVLCPDPLTCRGEPAQRVPRHTAVEISGPSPA